MKRYMIVAVILVAAYVVRVPHSLLSPSHELWVRATANTENSLQALWVKGLLSIGGDPNDSSTGYSAAEAALAVRNTRFFRLVLDEINAATAEKCLIMAESSGGREYREEVAALLKGKGLTVDHLDVVTP